MSKFTVYFVRHELTAGNEKGLLCGSTDALVSEQGRRELHELKQLSPARIGLLCPLDARFEKSRNISP